MVVCLQWPRPANGGTLRPTVPTAVGLASEAALHGVPSQQHVRKITIPSLLLLGDAHGKLTRRLQIHEIRPGLGLRSFSGLAVAVAIGGNDIRIRPGDLTS